MIIDPNVINKIESIVFTITEPSSTNVIWAKPSDPVGDYFTFYIFDGGEWHSVGEYTNIIAPEVCANLSAYNNDVGFVTSESLEGYASIEWVQSQGYATPSQLSDYVQKSNTAGLLKNDGTVDTNTYLTQHQDISGKQDKVTVEAASGATLTAVVDKYYTLSNVGTLAITLPTCTGTKIQSVVFYISTGSTPAVTFSSTHTILYSDGFEIAADSIYEVNALWNGTAWCLAMVKIEIPT